MEKLIFALHFLNQDISVKNILGSIFGKRDLLAIDHIMLALFSKYEIIS